jgi:hypothetical protein
MFFDGRIGALLLVFAASGCGDDARTETSTPEAGSTTCTPAGPTGLELGHTMEDLAFEGCDGASTSVHAFCGAKATVIVNFYGWCTTCYDYLDLADSLHAKYGSQGVEAIVVLTETAMRTPPTVEYCAKLRDQSESSVTTVMDLTRRLEQVGKADLVVVLDRNGKIVLSRIGPTENTVIAAIEQELVRED